MLGGDVGHHLHAHAVEFRIIFARAESRQGIACCAVLHLDGRPTRLFAGHTEHDLSLFCRKHALAHRHGSFKCIVQQVLQDKAQVGVAHPARDERLRDVFGLDDKGNSSLLASVALQLDSRL